MEVRQAAQVADDALAGEPASVSLWRSGRFTEATARSLIWLSQHRDRLNQALLKARDFPDSHAFSWLPRDWRRQIPRR